MGKVLFLNEQSKKYHEDKGIKIVNPNLRLVVNNGEVLVTKRTKKTKKPRRQTLGQRIYESLQDRNNDNEPA